MEEGGKETSGDGDRFLLYRIAKKYGLEWAIPGQTSPHTGELGRPPATQKPDQILLSQGAAVDILSSVNNHLQIPPFNSVPPDFQEIISSSRRRTQPLSSSGFQPIPMSRYSSEVSELASFLDVTPAAPGTPNFPTPVFPKAVGFSQYNVLSALEGITAVNILNALPESASEARSKVHAHLASLFFASLKRSSEALGSDLRAVRQTHLAGADQATRDELVHQPILSDGLYTDVSKLSIPIIDQPVSTRHDSYSPRLPSEVVRTPASPAYSNVTPSLGSYSAQVSPDGGWDLTCNNRTPSPNLLDLSSWGGSKTTSLEWKYGNSFK